MTGVAALLAEVEAAGARLRVDGGRLVATGARLPAPLVERLLAGKAAILAALAPPANAAGRSAAVDPTRCRYCGGRMPDLRVGPPATPSPRAWRAAAGAAPGAAAFGDRSVAHLGCHEAAPPDRARDAPPEARPDGAEPPTRGAPCP